MVFLDSLFKGSAAETAFSRCCNFLTCATEEGIDWSEWQFLIIPEEHIPQQLNLYDCGRFSIKWAEHIAFGIALDFQHDNIVDFRYSTILSLFTQNVEVDFQYCKISEGENTMENTQFTIELKKIYHCLKQKSTERRITILRKQCYIHTYQTHLHSLNTTMPKI